MWTSFFLNSVMRRIGDRQAVVVSEMKLEWLMVRMLCKDVLSFVLGAGPFLEITSLLARLHRKWTFFFFYRAKWQTKSNCGPQYFEHISISKLASSWIEYNSWWIFGLQNFIQAKRCFWSQSRGYTNWKS